MKITNMITNKTRKILYLFVLINIIFNDNCNGKIPFADFDTSMGKGSDLYNQCLQSEGTFSLAALPQSSYELYNFFKKLHNLNNISDLPYENEPIIPEIVHIIWLGGKYPDKYSALKNSWVHHHPNWTHIFWTDNSINYSEGLVIEDISNLENDLKNNKYKGQSIVININKLNIKNKVFYDQCSNYGQKSDILRYEIVYAFGGLYVDVDFECLGSFNDLHHKYDFYTGIQPLDIDVLALGIALFAAYPKHPILKYCIDHVNENVIDDGRWWIKLSSSSGPIHFTKSFWHMAKQSEERIIALPPSYVYPIGMKQKFLSRLEMQRNFKAETIANHHWGASWWAQ